MEGMFFAAMLFVAVANLACDYVKNISNNGNLNDLND
jgi:hypothetical protein